MVDITEQIVQEILKEAEPMLWKIARTSHIPGFAPDDLMQEMRIKIWQVVRDNDYDPDLNKETSYFYRVCKRHLIDLNKSKIYKYNSTLPENREYRDNLDQKTVLDVQEFDNNGEFPLSFVENFSETFKNSFF